MMKPADLRGLDDDALVGWLNLSGFWRILAEREVTTEIVVIGNIGSQYPTERFLAEHNDMVQALSTNGTYQALDKRGLPRRSRGDGDFGDVQAGSLSPEVVAIDAVTVSEQIAWSGVPRECLHDLRCGPLRSRMLGDVEVNDTPALMRQNQEDKQELEVDGRHDEEVH